MSFTVANLKTELGSILHGTVTDDISALNNLIYRASRHVLSDCDPQETKRVSQIANAIYDSVYDYAVPVDLKGNRIIDIRPQQGRTLYDNFSQTYQEQFDLYKDIKDNEFTIEFNSGVKTIRINKNLTSPIVLHQMNLLTDNGTWAATADAQNLSVDTQTKISGSGSLKFDLSGVGTSGYIENSTFTAIDLSNHQNISSLFCWVYLPDASLITSIDLRWGDSAAAYWNVTVTSPHTTSSFQNGWNLIRFDWNGATQTGAPTASSVNYARVTINYNGTADTDFRIDNIMSILGEIWEMVYYSKYLFRTSAGVWGETITADTDIINLDTDSYDLLVLKCGELAAQQVEGEDSAFDVDYFRRDYKEKLFRYNNKYKSEIEKPKQQYYRVFKQTGLDTYRRTQK